MVIVSLLYAGFQLGFAITASQSLGVEWAVFYVPAGIIGYLANIYVFTVAVLWSVIMIGVIIAICFLLIACAADK